MVPSVPGPVEVLGGLVLDTQVLGADGLSGLWLGGDLGLAFVGDRGRYAMARLVLRGGRPAGLAEIVSGPLCDGSGQPLQPGYEADAEALARLPDGTWLVAFERWHRIRAYRRLNGAAAYVEAPPGLERARRNAGLEALTVLADGRWLAIAEWLPGALPGMTLGWIGVPGRWTGIAYRPRQDFSVSDAAALPDGGALVLERRFSLLEGFDARLCRVSAAQLAEAASGAVLEGEEVLHLAPPLPADNWEGVAVAEHDGAWLVALVTDDNQSPLQRSLLLLCRMRP